MFLLEMVVVNIMSASLCVQNYASVTLKCFVEDKEDAVKFYCIQGGFIWDSLQFLKDNSETCLFEMRLHFAQLQDLLDNCGYEQGIITWPHINESENFYEANTGITLSQALGSRIHIL